MSRWPVRINPSMALALIAIVVAASGGAWAASKTSSEAITACVRHHGGAVYVANKCKRDDKRLSWNAIGPRGATGAPGTPGATGATGDQGIQGPPGPVDTSQLLHGTGTVTPIHLVDITNAHAGTLADVAGVGKLEIKACAGGDQDIRYTNTTPATEQVLISTDTDAVSNQADTFTTLVPTGFVDSTLDNSSHDQARVSVAIGTTGVAAFTISIGRSTGGDCLYWGDVYVG